MKYYPKSLLPNNIHIPSFIEPKVSIKKLSELGDIERDSNGNASIINIGTKYHPYINLEYFDTESNTWLWYDSNEGPYRISKNTTSWDLEPLWEFYGSTVNSVDINNIKYTDDGRKLGFYIEKNTNKYYSGSPIMLIIEQEVVNNVTSFINRENITLTDINPDENKEFYYKKSENKIYTNLNLLQYDQEEIKLYFYENIKNISINCKISSNQGGTSNLTPVIDYYILKLHGQSF